MLELKNINSGYEKLQIINNVSLAASPKEITIIIGPNGSGKSTLLRTIFGMCNVYSGNVVYNKADITKMQTYGIARIGLSYSPQNKNVFGTLTVQENLEMGRDFVEGEKTKIEEEIFSLFPRLKERRFSEARFLSGGERQMLAMARALMDKPEFLLLDEPSAGLSPKIMNEIFRKIVEINELGTGILLVEQNAKQAMEIANKIIVMENGSIAMQGGRELRNEKKVRHLFFGGVV